MQTLSLGFPCLYDFPVWDKIVVEREWSRKMDEKEFSHKPVLVDEVLEALGCHFFDSKTYLDCTVGLGGHTEAILNATSPHGRVIGIDRDEEVLQLARQHLSAYSGRLTLKKAAFSELLQIAKELHISHVDGILFDLGVSSYHLDHPERGFSFQKSGPLDMRMDRQQEETAADWISGHSCEELIKLIETCGEDRWARKIASAIIRYRNEKGAITRTDELEQIIWRAVPLKARYGSIHPATRTFQALRMAVNQEMEQIEAGLDAAISLLAVGGRLAVISFHSIEDRCVKQTFKKWAFLSEDVNAGYGRFAPLFKKVVIAKEEEVLENPRARSAKLRVLERVA